MNDEREQRASHAGEEVGRARPLRPVDAVPRSAGGGGEPRLNARMIEIMCRRRARRALSCIPPEVRIAAAATQQPSQHMQALCRAHYEMIDEYSPSDNVFHRACMLYDRVCAAEERVNPPSAFREACTRFVHECDVALSLRDEVRAAPHANVFAALGRIGRAMGPVAPEFSAALLRKPAACFQNEALRSHVPYTKTGSVAAHADHLIEFQFVNAILSAVLTHVAGAHGVPVDDGTFADVDRAVARFPWMSVLLSSLSAADMMTPLDAKTNQAKKGVWKMFINRMFATRGWSLQQAAAASSSSQTESVVLFFKQNEKRLEHALIVVLRSIVSYSSTNTHMTDESKLTLAYTVVSLCEVAQQALGLHERRRRAAPFRALPGPVACVVLLGTFLLLVTGPLGRIWTDRT